MSKCTKYLYLFSRFYSTQLNTSINLRALETNINVAINLPSITSTPIRLPGPVHLALLGAPGSGKGTLTQWLVKDYDVVSISTGNILRKESLSDTPFGHIIQALLQKGEYVPDEIVNSIVSNELSRNGKSNWLLDGFPRTLQQAIFLNEFLNKINTPLTSVIYVDPPEDVLVERLSDRWTHLPSGRVYGKAYPPRIPGVDDFTGESLIRRTDDQPEVIRQRLKTCKSTLSPILDYYEKKNLIRRFNFQKSTLIYSELISWLTSKTALMEPTLLQAKS